MTGYGGKAGYDVWVCSQRISGASTSNAICAWKQLHVRNASCEEMYEKASSLLPPEYRMRRFGRTKFPTSSRHHLLTPLLSDIQSLVETTGASLTRWCMMASHQYSRARSHKQCGEQKRALAPLVMVLSLVTRCVHGFAIIFSREESCKEHYDIPMLVVGAALGLVVPFRGHVSRPKWLPCDWWRSTNPQSRAWPSFPESAFGFETPVWEFLLLDTSASHSLERSAWKA